MTIYFGLLHFMRYYVVFSSYLSQVVYFEEQVKMEEKEVKKERKGTKCQSPAQSAQVTNAVPVTDVTGRVTSVTRSSLVTDVTHSVTSVTQLHYLFGASIALRKT